MRGSFFRTHMHHYVLHYTRSVHLIVHVRGRASCLPCTTTFRTKVDAPECYVNWFMEESSCLLRQDDNKVSRRVRLAGEKFMSLPYRVF